jgi:hypothetical protein
MNCGLGCILLICHGIFIVAHGLALLFGFVGLIITVPTHLIFTAVTLCISDD